MPVAADTAIAHRPVPVVDAPWPTLEVPEGPVSSAAFLRAAGHAGRLVPAPVYDALTDLGTDADGVGAVIIAGVPVGDVGPTPASPTEAARKDRVSEFSLLTAGRLLGEPVGYLPEHGGDVIQNILPTHADATRQTSTSSAVQLAFHTETTFHPHRPRFLLLLCVRGDPAAATTLCCIDDVLPGLTADQQSILRSPRFGTRADESFGGGGDAEFGEPIAVLRGSPDHPVLRFDAQLTEGADPEAQSALDALTALVERHHTAVTLESGDLLVVDNSRCVHGRSPFRPRFDGSDRWLQRAFVVADLTDSADERNGRIITTRF